MKSIVLGFCIIFSFNISAQEDIHWMTWDEALSAREQFITDNKEAIDAQKMFPKKIFIDVYTDWCGWCKRMDATTFKDPNVVDYMNRNYFAVKLDAEMKDTIEFNGHKFHWVPSGRNGVHTLAASLLENKLSYPSYLIMDENVQRAMILQGYKQAEDLLGTLIYFKTNQHLIYKRYLEEMQQAQKLRDAQMGQ